MVEPKHSALYLPLEGPNYAIWLNRFQKKGRWKNTAMATDNRIFREPLIAGKKNALRENKLESMFVGLKPVLQASLSTECL